MGAFVLFSGVLKRIAVKLSKICNDLRLLSSGPRAGFGEIRLPAVQAGSSIMPGKVNPVIPEVVNQVAFMVIGHDLTVTCAPKAGNYSSMRSSRRSATACCRRFAISARRYHADDAMRQWHRGRRERCLALVEDSIGLITALGPRWDMRRRRASQSGHSRKSAEWPISSWKKGC